MRTRPGSQKKQKIEFEKKIRAYRKFLKDDQDWDYAHIIRLLSYKLKRTRQCIVSNDFVKSAPKIGRQIQAVETLLNRVADEQYYDKKAKTQAVAHRLRQKDLKKAFDLMLQNIWFWWD